jgi:magnesium transporter
MTMIVNCVAYRDGKRIGDISIEAISDVIQEPGTFIWLGLHEHDPEILLQLQEEFGLHDLAIEDARNAHQRPKIEVYGDSLFIVVKTAQLGDDNEILYGETHFFVGAKFLVSVRHGCSQGYARMRDRCEHQPGMLAKGPGFALYSLMDFIVDNYQPVIAQLEREFDQLEGDTFKGQFDQIAIERLYDLKIKLIQLRNAVEPIEDICRQLMRFHHEIIAPDLRAYFRDINDHAARIIGTIDNLREMLTTAMQVNLALVTVRQNEVVKRLAGWGAILAIPTVMFSLYGMNFKVMPELQWSHAGTAMALGLSNRADHHRRHLFGPVPQAEGIGLAVVVVSAR